MYYVYILQCADNTFYSGMTNDVEKRLLAHNKGKRGARYTRGRRPVVLMYTEACKTKGDALKREAAIKKMTHARKRELITIPQFRRFNL